MDSKERLHFARIRSVLGKPNPEDETQFLESFEYAAKAQLEQFNDEQLVLSELEALRKAVQEGSSRSRLALSAWLVRGAGKYLQEQMQLALANSNMASFRFFYDTYHGLVGCMNKVLIAESELAGGAQEAISSGISSAGDVANISVSKQSEEFLFFVREAQTNANLLKQDPSGFSLIDSHITGLEAGTEFQPCSKAYYVAGAKLAAEAYKAVYAISAKLTS